MTIKNHDLNVMQQSSEQKIVKPPNYKICRDRENGVTFSPANDHGNELPKRRTTIGARSQKLKD